MSRAQETVYLPGLEKLVAELAEKQDSPRNVNQQALEIGIDRSAYHNIIRRRKGASLAVARDIARYFGVPIESLLGPAPKKISEIVSI